MALAGQKSIFKSLTAGGGVVMLLPMLLKLVGLDLGEDIGSVAAQTVDLVVQLSGLVMVIYGRIRASKKAVL
jgi:hypothetical protein